MPTVPFFDAPNRRAIQRVLELFQHASYYQTYLENSNNIRICTRPLGILKIKIKKTLLKDRIRLKTIVVCSFLRSDPDGHNQLQRIPSVARRVECEQTVRRESVTGEKPSGFRDVRIVFVRFGVDRVFLPRLHGDDGPQVRGASRLHHLDADTADQQPLDRTSVHLLVSAGRAHALQRPEDIPRPSQVHAGRVRPSVFGTVFLRAGTDGLHGQVFPIQKPQIQAVHRRYAG